MAAKKRQAASDIVKIAAKTHNARRASRDAAASSSLRALGVRIAGFTAETTCARQGGAASNSMAACCAYAPRAAHRRRRWRHACMRRPATLA